MPKATKKTPRSCSAGGCKRVHEAKGFCELHYRRLPEQVAKARLQRRHHYTASQGRIKQLSLLRKKKWLSKRPGLSTAISKARKAAKKQRIPKWADLKAIQVFYENCPPGHHVDHIVPLCGKQVSGLHVLENLQYLPAEENLRKLNKFEPKVEPYPWPK